MKGFVQEIMCCFSILMQDRKSAWNSLNTRHALHFTALMRKCKEVVNPSDILRHKSGTASWGKWSQYSHPCPSLLITHLHLVSATAGPVKLCRYLLWWVIPSLWLSSHCWWLAPHMDHKGGTKPNFRPIFSLLSLQATKPSSTRRKWPIHTATALVLRNRKLFKGQNEARSVSGLPVRSKWRYRG